MTSLFYVRFVPPNAEITSTQAEQFKGLDVHIGGVGDDGPPVGKIESVLTDPEGYSVAVFSIHESNTLKELERGTFGALGFTFVYVESGEDTPLGFTPSYTTLETESIFEHEGMGTIQKMTLGLLDAR